MITSEKLRKLLSDALFPQYNACHLCGAYPERPGLLCSRCLKRLQQLRYPPPHMPSPEPHPPLTVCLAAYPHRQEARTLIHLLKYDSDCVLAQLLGESMADALLSAPNRPMADAVVPVPLHAARLEERGYNQALLLAQAVCRHTGLALLDRSIIRLHPTDSQLRRSRRQRMQAMARAFAVTQPGAVRGCRILLVDDVLTTGATSVSCAAALLSAGAQSVSLLTACRTERQG